METVTLPGSAILSQFTQQELDEDLQQCKNNMNYYHGKILHGLRNQDALDDDEIIEVLEHIITHKRGLTDNDDIPTGFKLLDKNELTENSRIFTLIKIFELMLDLIRRKHQNPMRRHGQHPFPQMRDE